MYICTDGHNLIKSMQVDSDGQLFNISIVMLQFILLRNNCVAKFNLAAYGGILTRDECPTHKKKREMALVRT